MKNLRTIMLISLAILAVVLLGAWQYVSMYTKDTDQKKEKIAFEGDAETAIFAGGCFWCVEADLEKVDGVLKVLSGYAGGTTESPTYDDYAAGGHREVVEVTYDSNVVSYGQLVEYLIKHIDPTDGEGSFYDRGVEYAPAVYYGNEEEKEIAEGMLKKIDSSGVYERPLAVSLLERPRFWMAEGYHQDYYKEHALKYSFYRKASGRDAYIAKHWVDDAGVLAEENLIVPSWKSFEKPSDEVLREILTSVQYKVTQKGGTERPFENEYDQNYRDGIYVDIVSGEPLYSSLDKYDSGTGWPSFSKPLVPENIIEKKDWSSIWPRTEVRSKYGDSHLGHVFEDGPESTGLRYCMNSAALRFIPKENLISEGYSEYLSSFE